MQLPLCLCEKGGVYNGRLLPPGNDAAATPQMIGHLAGVGDVGEHLTDAQPVQRPAGSASKADLSRPLRHVSQGVLAGSVAGEPIPDERRGNWVQDHRARVVALVTKRQRPQELALAGLLGQPRHDTVCDNVALELGQGAQDVADHPPGGGAGVDGLLNGDDAHSQGL
ncbi:MAG: hypothetical protein ABSB57_02440 [Dehalococcoidia bacterium]